MSKAKYDYLMDYIIDKSVYKAVSFAASMIRKGTGKAQAIRTASRYYDVDMSEVAHYLGQRGGRKRAESQ